MEYKQNMKYTQKENMIDRLEQLQNTPKNMSVHFSNLSNDQATRLYEVLKKHRVKHQDIITFLEKSSKSMSAYWICRAGFEDKINKNKMNFSISEGSDETIKEFNSFVRHGNLVLKCAQKLILLKSDWSLIQIISKDAFQQELQGMGDQYVQAMNAYTADLLEKNNDQDRQKINNEIELTLNLTKQTLKALDVKVRAIQETNLDKLKQKNKKYAQQVKK